MASNNNDDRLQPRDVSGTREEQTRAQDPIRRAAKQRKTARKQAAEDLPEVEDPSNVPLRQKGRGYRIEKDFLGEIKQKRVEKAKEGVRQSVAEDLPEVDNPEKVPVVREDDRVVPKPSFLDNIEQERKAEAKADLRKDVAEELPTVSDPSKVPVSQTDGGEFRVPDQFLDAQQREAAASSLSEALGVEVTAEEVQEKDGGFTVPESIQREAAADRASDKLGISVGPEEITRRDGEYGLEKDAAERYAATQLDKEWQEEDISESDVLATSAGPGNWEFELREGTKRDLAGERIASSIDELDTLSGANVVETSSGTYQPDKEVRKRVLAERYNDALRENDALPWVRVEPSDITDDYGKESELSLTRDTREEIAARQYEQEYPGITFDEADIVALNQAGTDLRLSTNKRREVIAETADDKYESVDIEGHDLLLNDETNRFQFRKGLQKQLAADRLAEETGVDVGAEDVRATDDGFTIDEQLQREIAAEELDTEVPGVDVGTEDVEKVADGKYAIDEQNLGADAGQPIDEQAANSDRSPADARRAFRLADAGGSVALPDDTADTERTVSSGFGVVAGGVSTDRGVTLDDPDAESDINAPFVSGLRNPVQNAAETVDNTVLEPLSSAFLSGEADSGFGVTNADIDREETTPNPVDKAAAGATEALNPFEMADDALSLAGGAEFLGRSAASGETTDALETIGETAGVEAQRTVETAQKRPARTAGALGAGLLAGGAASATVRGVSRSSSSGDAAVDVAVDDTPGSRPNPFGDIDYSQPIDEQTGQLFARPGDSPASSSPSSRIQRYREEVTSQLREFVSDERGQVQVGRQRQRDPDTGDQPYEPLDGRVIEDDDLGTPDPVGEELGRRRIAERQQLRDEGQDVGQPAFRRQDRRDTSQDRRRRAQQRRVTDADGRDTPDLLGPSLGLGLGSAADTATRQPIDEQVLSGTDADTATRPQTAADTATATVPDLASPLRGNNTPTKTPDERDRDTPSREVPKTPEVGVPKTPDRTRPRTPDLPDRGTPEGDLDREFAFDAAVEEEITTFVNPLTGERTDSDRGDRPEDDLLPY